MPSPIPLKHRHLTHRDKRPREYLYESEVESLIKVAREGNNPLRDQTLLLLCYRHGLRSSEICKLTWSQVDLENYRIHINRGKNGYSSSQPLKDREIRLLRRMWEARKDSSPYIFLTNRGNVFNKDIFIDLMNRLGVRAKLLIPKVHPHMLRHATGYKLANDGVDTRTIQDYLGHVNINNTVIYTRLNEKKFDNLWKD